MLFSSIAYIEAEFENIQAPDAIAEQLCHVGASQRKQRPSIVATCSIFTKWCIGKRSARSGQVFSLCIFRLLTLSKVVPKFLFPMHIDEFHFELPEGLIAQHPAPIRDHSRLMVLDRGEKSVRHHRFNEIGQFLNSGDALVVNRTRVFPARLRGVTTVEGTQIELLLIREKNGGRWLAMGRPGKRLRLGAKLEFGDDLRGEVTDRRADGRLIVDFNREKIGSSICRVGEVPLPPYIRRPVVAADLVRYQTVYARDSGAVAAPTAGLHFTTGLLKRLTESDVSITSILLHVGPGTFAPIKVEDPRKHILEPEYFEIDRSTAEGLNGCRQRGGRVVAVGTTVVRALETQVGENGEICNSSGWTDKLIYPPYRFRAVDSLVTNFHLPRSSLLMMVAAFAGAGFVREAYRIAVEEEYRFYSYGDAMLIL